MKLERPTIINEPKERLSATLEEHMKAPQDKKRDRNPGARLVKRAFQPAYKLISKMEETKIGREILGFLALTLTVSQTAR